MKRSFPPVRHLLTCLLSCLFLISLFSIPVLGKERTADEFKNYVKTKLPNLSEAQISKLVKLVDKDNDGKISNVEFEARFEALNQLSNESTNPKESSDESKENFNKQSLVSSYSPALPKNTNVALLLITSSKVAEHWAPFAAWKTKTGKSTQIVTVEGIRSHYKAKTIQEKIRLCVRDYIEKHKTRWVVLGGDCLPGGKGLVPGGPLTVHRQEPKGIPTDIIYISPTNWDADSDGVYGEWKDDREAITYPDGKIGLGRIPVRTPADIKAFTEKVIAYESRYPSTDFAQQMIYTCTDAPAYPKVRKSWDGYVSKVWKNGEARRYFSQKTPWDKEGKPGSFPLSGENLVELINKKEIGKFHIHGHGLLPIWILEKSVFSKDHVRKLKNDGAYPLITTVSCNTGEFDSAKDPSIVESMIRKEKGGSVAIVAPIRTGKPHFHKRSDFRLMVTEGKLDGTTKTMTQYWSNGLGKSMTTGEALMTAKAELAADAVKSPNYHLCISEINLLGDPTLDMRAKSPKAASFVLPENLKLGEQELKLQTNTPASWVCLWKGDEIYQVGQANSKGEAKFNIDIKTKGKLFISVSGKSLNSVVHTVMVNS